MTQGILISQLPRFSFALDYSSYITFVLQLHITIDFWATIIYNLIMGYKSEVMK